MMEITEKGFFILTGLPPVQDDLERTNCKKAGEILHTQCGICKRCDRPKFTCICHAIGNNNDYK